MTPTPVAARAPGQHVAIVHQWVAHALLDGTKTIESRFSRDKRPPFGRVARGAEVYFRVAGGGYAVRSRVASVKYIEGLTPKRVARLEAEHRASIGGDNAYWLAVRSARCVTLVYLEGCQAVDAGPALNRQRGDRRAWFVLD